jgi:diguanylate cyclase (GGDEF)-like protein
MKFLEPLARGPVIDFLVPSSLDARQAVRLRRFGLAALTYFLCSGLVAVAWAFGVLPGAAVLDVGLAFLATNLVLYVVIRSGFNLRFRDPSLTRFQILVGITLVMYLAYHMDDGREVALFGCFLVYLFGIFRLSSRQFTLITLYTLAAYALVINLLIHLRPEAIHDVRVDLLTWLMFAGFLPCFTFIGGQVNTLKRGLRESEARFRALTEMSSDFYWETDVEHRITARSLAESRTPAASRLWKRVPVGKQRWEVPSLSPDEAGWAAHRAALDAHRSFRCFEVSRRDDDGTVQHVSISGDPVFDADGTFKGYRGVGTDVTPRKRFEEELRVLADDIQHVAHHDSLTGLPNRLLFNDRLDQAFRLAKRDTRRIGLLFLDLNKFKPVNDVLGHAAGDELLKAVAGRIRAQVRAADTVARIGGDEFTVTLHAIDGRGDAEVVAAKIVAALAAPFQIGASKERVEIGTSIGIAIYPDDAHSPDTLVKAADAAMYRAKRDPPPYLSLVA